MESLDQLLAWDGAKKQVWPNLEGVKLHIRIAMCKTLDHGGHNILRPVHKRSVSCSPADNMSAASLFIPSVAALNLVADILDRVVSLGKLKGFLESSYDNVFPVLRCQVLVSCLGCAQ